MGQYSITLRIRLPNPLDGWRRRKKGHNEVIRADPQPNEEPPTLAKLPLSRSTETIEDIQIDDPDRLALVSSVETSYRDVYVSGTSSAVVGNVHYHYHCPCREEHTSTLNPNCHQRKAWNKARPTPLESFEMQGSFRPNAYTCQSKELMLFEFSAQTVNTSDYSRSYLLMMLYRTDLGTIVHVPLAIEVKIQSKYWHILTADSEVRGTNSGLPAALLSEIEKWLGRNGANWGFRVNLMCTLQETPRFTVGDHRHALVFRPYNALRTRLSDLSKTIKHSNCKWYYEEDLARRSLFPNDRSSYSLVYIHEEKKWACETRFSSIGVKLEYQLYDLEVLRCLQMRNSPVGPHFIGVVRDKQEYVVGYLIEYPARGHLVQMIQDGMRRGQPVSQSRRDKWCYQLLQTVAEVHDQGHVVGLLGVRVPGLLAISADDRAVYVKPFKPKLIKTHWYPGTVPPEHRGSKGYVKVTPETDLFQLGLVLWRVAGQHFGEGDTDFCPSVGCQAQPGVRCSEPHTDPVGLPMLGGDVGRELQQVINICRAEDPEQRSTAVELLKMLPEPTVKPDEAQGWARQSATRLLDAEFYQKKTEHRQGALVMDWTAQIVISTAIFAPMVIMTFVSNASSTEACIAMTKSTC